MTLQGHGPPSGSSVYLGYARVMPSIARRVSSLCRAPGSESGSDGIRDQQLALRWVHEHIAVFGGDADNVTVFGELAVARSVCVHLAAPSSRGLAQRYIVESGVCLGGPLGMRTKTDADALGVRLSDALCPGQADVLGCLRAVPADVLASWGDDLSLIGAGWDPVVGGVDALLPDDPEQLLARADVAPVPVIVGTNAHEWGTFQLTGSPHIADLTQFKATLAKIFGAHASLVEAQYPAESDAVANDVFVRLATDLVFRCPTQVLARLLSDHGGSVYMYQFEQGRAIHGQELDYVFDTNLLTAILGEPPPSAELVRTVQRYWTHFAATGDPNVPDAPSWPRCQTSSEQALALADSPRTITAPTAPACDFWSDYVRAGGTVVDLFAR